MDIYRIFTTFTSEWEFEYVLNMVARLGGTSGIGVRGSHLARGVFWGKCFNSFYGSVRSERTDSSPPRRPHFPDLIVRPSCLNHFCSVCYWQLCLLATHSLRSAWQKRRVALKKEVVSKLLSARCASACLSQMYSLVSVSLKWIIVHA